MWVSASKPSYLIAINFASLLQLTDTLSPKEKTNEVIVLENNEENLNFSAELWIITYSHP